MNVDHVATLRQARRVTFPDPVAAALECEKAGADGITAHLREDRRHIVDSDVGRLRSHVRSYFNLEIACTRAMLDIACEVRPNQVTLVPERREEITTEGGLNLESDPPRVAAATLQLRESGVRVSLFIDPTVAAVERSLELGAEAVELHTGRFSVRPTDETRVAELAAAARRGADIGLAVHAGHGLSAENLRPVAAIPEIEELNIGHAIVSRAVFTGLSAAVREVRAAMDAARGEGLAIPCP